MAPRICESPGCGTELRWWEQITGCRRANEHGRLASAYYDVLVDRIVAARAEEAAERADVPTQVINGDAQKPEKGESASIKAPMETIVRQQDVEAAEEVNVSAQADSNAVQEQEESHQASIKDARVSTTRQVQIEDLAESLREVSARLEAARMAKGGLTLEEEHLLASCMPNVATRDSLNEWEDVPRARFASSVDAEHADRTDAAPEADPTGHLPTANDRLKPMKRSSHRSWRCRHRKWDKVLDAGSCDYCFWFRTRRHFMPYFLLGRHRPRMPYFLYKCRTCHVYGCHRCARYYGRLYG